MNQGENQQFSLWHVSVRFYGFVFDACAGPALGTMTHPAYLTNAVDTSTPEEQGLTPYQYHPRVKGKVAEDIGNKKIDSFEVEVQ